MTLSLIRRSGVLVALAAILTAIALVGAASTAQAACPKDQIPCQTEPPEPRPDLVVSSVYHPTQVTVKNIGNAAATAFWVRVASAGNQPEMHVKIGGLAANRSASFNVQSVCETPRPVFVDSRFNVGESNEKNNGGLFAAKVC